MHRTKTHSNSKYFKYFDKQFHSNLYEYSHYLSNRPLEWVRVSEQCTVYIKFISLISIYFRWPTLQSIVVYRLIIMIVLIVYTTHDIPFFVISKSFDSQNNFQISFRKAVEFFLIIISNDGKFKMKS